MCQHGADTVLGSFKIPLLPTTILYIRNYFAGKEMERAERLSDLPEVTQVVDGKSGEQWRFKPRIKSHILSIE